jgi:hypothetical protein
MTTRQRRTSANPGNFAIEQDDDRVYTEDDYIKKPSESLPDEWEEESAYAQPGWTTDAPLPDEAFQPDEEELPPEDFPEEEMADYAEDAYLPLFDPNDDFTEDIDPLSEELLTDEERAELRRSRWQLLAGLADFAGVILGTAAILLVVTLLVSLLNWLINDLSQSFILLQKHL